jgi:hypothetical protein
MISRLVGLRDDYVPTGFKPYGVKMHIFVSFLAYCLYVTLGQRLRALAPGLTARAVLEKMSALQMVDVRVPTTDGRLLILPRYTQPEKEHRMLLHELHLQLPAQPPRGSSSRR